MPFNILIGPNLDPRAFRRNNPYNPDTDTNREFLSIRCPWVDDLDYMTSRQRGRRKHRELERARKRIE